MRGPNASSRDSIVLVVFIYVKGKQIGKTSGTLERFVFGFKIYFS